MNHYEFSFQVTDTTQQEELIALLSSIGFTGFDESNDACKAYIPVDDFDETAFNQILDIIAISFTKSIIKEENWNAIWESGFEPVTIPSFQEGKPWVRIRAGFHDADASISIDINITPRMSFGTGHHATTYMMVQLMGIIPVTGTRVIDFGSGTGVLAILAEKLGASSVLAIDYDPWCISNAADNLHANQCTKIRLEQLDKMPKVGEPVDIILANINLNIIKDNLDAISDAVKPGGWVLFSGLLRTDAPEFDRMISDKGLQKIQYVEKDQWAAWLTQKL